MTAYEIADAERKQFWDRKMLVKEQMQSVTDPAELDRQKKRHSILDAMYKDALERMEAARPASQKKHKAPKTRCISYNACGRDGKSFDWLERNHVTFSDLEGNTTRWDEVDVEVDDPKIKRMMRALKRADAVCTPRQKEMMSLFAQGKTIHQIAETTGVDKSTASRTLSRAKAHIRDLETGMALKEKISHRDMVDLSNPITARRMLSRLTETQAVYIYLYFGEWLSMRDIGTLLGVDHSSVCRTLHRAAGKIAAMCEEDTCDGVELLGVDSIEPALYELYRQRGIDDLIPERAKAAAAKANKNRCPKRGSPAGASRGFDTRGLYAQAKRRPMSESRLLRALQEDAARRARNVFDLLRGVIKRFFEGRP